MSWIVLRRPGCPLNDSPYLRSPSSSRVYGPVFNNDLMGEDISNRSSPVVAAPKYCPGRRRVWKF
ncbi:hypothetical protein C368_04107 [Cryptococcus neoformans 125.91]|nr:hypothetical protein C368_04107 [Cryptococcus neoformans var. grubii 125.91]OXC60455.1 hypothetical protein AYX13_07091 [Cryptococcus neoformans var. grubii]